MPRKGDKPTVDNQISGQNATFHLMRCISDLYDQHSWTNKQRNSLVSAFREQCPLLKKLQQKEDLAH